MESGNGEVEQLQVTCHQSLSYLQICQCICTNTVTLACSRHYLCSVGYRYLFHVYYDHLTTNVHFMIIVALHCF